MNRNHLPAHTNAVITNATVEDIGSPTVPTVLTFPTLTHSGYGIWFGTTACGSFQSGIESDEILSWSATA